MKEKKLINLSEILYALDTKDRSYYDKLSDEKKKEFSPWLLMRYASSSNLYPAHYLCFVNELVNCEFNELTKHPKLQWLLLTVCGSGSKQFHEWILPPKKRKKNKIEEFLSNCYPLLKYDELTLLISLLSKEDIKELAKGQGNDDKFIAELLA